MIWILGFLLFACDHGDVVNQEVLAPENRRYDVDIDRCLSPIVKALNDAGISTISSCCNHHKTPWGYILLEDRLILISEQSDSHTAYNLYMKLCEPDARYWELQTKIGK